jgi:Putative auto-transporter adhesin, head GIN domain
LKKNNPHIKTIITAIIFIALFSSCTKENGCDCIKRTGPIVTQKREISGFNQIYVNDNLDVYITQDTVFEVIVEAGKNIRGLISTEVRDGVLYIDNNNRCNWTRSYKEPHNVYIKMPEIKYITSNGTGNIKGLNTFTTSEFDIRTKNSGDIELTVNNSRITSHVFGASDLTLHGYTKEHNCDIGGTAFLKCMDLRTNYTWIHTFTTGLSYVVATDSLWCKIDNIGDLYYFGFGKGKVVDKTISSSGQLYLQ